MTERPNGVWPALPFAALAPTAQTLQLFAQVAGKVFVDKHPLNTLKLPLIARLSAAGKARPIRLRPVLADDLFDLGAEARRDVGACERVGDVRGKEADLGAAIEAAAREFQAIEALRL